MKPLSRRKQLAAKYTDADKISCQICGEKFLVIMKAHLATHNIIPNDYKIKFNLKSLTCEAMQKAKLEAFNQSEKTRIRKPAWNKGIAATDEAKEKQSKLMKEQFASGSIIHWNTGKYHSEETKEKISNSLEGKSYFTEETLIKRNNTIAEKVRNGWISPLKGREISADHKQKSSKILIKLNNIKSEKANKLIVEKCIENNLTLITIENNYYLTLQCNVCENIFNNTRQVFNFTKNDGKELCPQCYPKDIIVSKMEISLREEVQKLLPDKILDFNNRKILGGKEIDIYIPSLNIGIEFTGLYWHSVQTSGNDYHLMHKMQFAYSKGIKLLTIYENEWLQNKEIVLSRLNSVFGINRKIYARNTIIKPLSLKDAKIFLTENHIQGNCVASIRYGLYHDNVLVAIMTFGKSRFDKNIEFELLRYCSILNTSVVGGASKLFKHFIKNNNPNNVISYSDRRWNTGNLYKMLDFDFISTTPPNYYWIEKNTIILQSRLQFQKHKLQNKLKIFDESLSSSENMFNNGYRKIFDCGMTKWLWTKS